MLFATFGNEMKKENQMPQPETEILCKRVQPTGSLFPFPLFLIAQGSI